MCQDNHIWRFYSFLLYKAIIWVGTYLVFADCWFLAYTRIQCRSGMCTTPIQVTSCQLTANEIFPLPVVRTLLYPGAAANGLITNMTLPKWNDLLQMYNLTEVKNASDVVDLHRLEVCASLSFKNLISSQQTPVSVTFYHHRFLLEATLLLREP